MQKIEIDTPRLIIRNLQSHDLPRFYLYRSDPAVTKYQGFDVMDNAQCESFINSNLNRNFGKPGEWVQYGIESKISNLLIGDCAIKLNLLDPRIAEIGITISPIEQNKGYAKECMSAIITFLFNNDVLRIVETVDVDNTASIRLLECLNFRKEGHFLENVFFKGKWGSEFQYAMLKREWGGLKTNAG